jgi:hypothetical protein
MWPPTGGFMPPSTPLPIPTSTTPQSTVKKAPPPIYLPILSNLLPFICANLACNNAGILVTPECCHFVEHDTRFPVFLNQANQLKMQTCLLYSKCVM